MALWTMKANDAAVVAREFESSAIHLQAAVAHLQDAYRLQRDRK